MVEVTVLTPPEVSKQPDVEVGLIQKIDETQFPESKDSSTKRPAERSVIENYSSVDNQWNVTEQQGPPGLSSFNLESGKSAEEPSNSKWHTMSTIQTEQNRTPLFLTLYLLIVHAFPLEDT